MDRGGPGVTCTEDRGCAELVSSGCSRHCSRGSPTDVDEVGVNQQSVFCMLSDGVLALGRTCHSLGPMAFMNRWAHRLY